MVVIELLTITEGQRRVERSRGTVGKSALVGIYQVLNQSVHYAYYGYFEGSERGGVLELARSPPFGLEY